MPVYLVKMEFLAVKEQLIPGRHETKDLTNRDAIVDYLSVKTAGGRLGPPAVQVEGLAGARLFFCYFPVRWTWKVSVECNFKA